jgi:hypothetical protein
MVVARVGEGDKGKLFDRYRFSFVRFRDLFLFFLLVCCIDFETGVSLFAQAGLNWWAQVILPPQSSE